MSLRTRYSDFSNGQCQSGQQCSSDDFIDRPRKMRYSKSRRESDQDGNRSGKKYGYYCDAGCSFKRPRYSADIVLRPLISQNGSGPSEQCSPAARGCLCANDDIRDRWTASDSTDNTYGKRRRSRDLNINRSIRNRSSPGPWIRLIAVILLVIFSLAALLERGQCQSVLGASGPGTAVANSTSGLDFLSIGRGDQQNRKDRHGAIDPRTRRLADDPPGGWTGRREEEGDGEGDKQRMSKAAFRRLSRLAFKALISEDFQDRPLRAPDAEETLAGEEDLTVEGRRQIRRQHRKLERQRQQLAREGGEEEGDLLPPPSDFNHREIDETDDSSITDQRGDRRIPGRRRAIAIATKDNIKPDSCRTVPLKQRVRMAGCTTKIVVNHFCYGQCNSFFIPKLSKKRLRAAFESCSVCRPKMYVPVAVTLHCPTRNPAYVKRKIMKVKECACMPAHISDNDIPQP